MPHYRLLDTTQMSIAEIALRCARLYLQSGKRRLQKGRNALGMAALYDAMLFGMRYYIAKHEGYVSFAETLDLWDATGLFYMLTRTGVFDDPQAFNRFSLLVERALWLGSYSFDTDSVLAEVEKMLSKLGVIPFNESILQGESIAAC